MCAIQDCQSALGVIFDGDDTLWSSEQLYDAARSRGRLIVSNSGANGAEWERCERLLDVQNVAKFQYGTDRFPTSCVQAYEELCRTSGRRIDNGIAIQIRQAAKSAFEHDPPVMPHARETLALLRSRGAKLALLTKGDYALQCRRIERSGLRDCFDVIRIVPEKTPDVIRDVVRALGIDAGSTWMVGNSIRSDILPAMKAGLRTVRIPAHVWEYERNDDQNEPDGLITVFHLAEVPTVITK